ncbi:MAG TPA: hydroxysqualene dehydroxylase HpnE [Myxococcota bacterium]|jgi:squalene-associated FAD-dependent desaturase
MSELRVAVVGGGLAGLSAGLACADAGARVTLLEARPRLGGATWSTRHQGLAIDNGQHVFLRCCTAYRGFLDRIGASDLVALQSRLAIPVVAPAGRTAWLRRHPLPAPLHLAPSLARYAHVSWADRLRIAAAARKLAKLDLADPALDARSFGDWLAQSGQSPRAIELFWELVIRPTLNAGAGEASLALAAMVFQTGLLREADAADIGWARVPLEQVHAEPAARALAERGAEVVTRARVREIELRGASVAAVRLDAGRVPADAVILATPHAEAAGLLPAESGVDIRALAALASSPIVNLHVVWDRKILAHAFAAAVASPLQWIFDRTQASGLARGQYLAVSLSAAEAYVGVSSDSLRRRFEPEFRRLFPAARAARLEKLFVTSEPAATFRQAPGSQRLRAATQTRVDGLYLAGAWTDTGWPATMEGAVRSGLAAARAALAAAGRRQGLPQVAA